MDPTEKEVQIAKSRRESRIALAMVILSVVICVAGHPAGAYSIVTFAIAGILLLAGCLVGIDSDFRYMAVTDDKYDWDPINGVGYPKSKEPEDKEKEKKGKTSDPIPPWFYL